MIAHRAVDRVGTRHDLPISRPIPGAHPRCRATAVTPFGRGRITVVLDDRRCSRSYARRQAWPFLWVETERSLMQDTTTGCLGGEHREFDG